MKNQFQADELRIALTELTGMTMGELMKTIESIPENKTCPSKTGRVTRKTGKTSVDLSGNVLANAAKEVPPIPTVEPKMENPILLPEVELSLPLPILTMNPETVNLKTSELGANAVTSPMMPSITPKTESAGRALSVISSNRRSLTGSNKKPTRQELLRAIQGDELALQQHAILLEAYKPTMDAIKLYLEIHGSQSPNFYMTKNKQVAAACQMNGINDPNATRKQRIAAMTCYEFLMESIMTGLELSLDKERIKELMNDAINRAAEFFNLGNKKSIKARNKAQRKAA